jgi:hypothetical protein
VDKQDEIQAEMDAVEAESLVLEAALSDTEDAPVEPEERWGYIDLAHLWQAYDATDREDLRQLVGEVVTSARWGLSASVPLDLQGRVDTALIQFERVTLVAEFARLLRADTSDEEIAAAYRRLYQAYGYDDVAVARAIHAHSRDR